MPPLEVQNLVHGLKNSGCTSAWFVHTFVEERVQLPFDTLTTQAWHEFTDPGLKEVFFAEVHHFINRALYHLAIGKKLVAQKNPTWGLVSFYYASFFAAQAAVRLRGVIYIRLAYDAAMSKAPTYRLEVLNLITDRYRVRKASVSGGGEHQRLWKAFYELFFNFGNRPGYEDVSPITDIDDPEERLADMHRRHLLNYAPGFGYSELGSPKDLNALVTALSREVPGRFSDALLDDDGQMEARALLRLRLCCGLLKEIAAGGGSYGKLHSEQTKIRKALLKDLHCPTKLATHLGSLF